MLQIRWRKIITMDLGLILELGNRKRLVILGRVSVIMPSEKQDLIRLQMNALGVIDFDQDSISLDAVPSSYVALMCARRPSVACSVTSSSSARRAASPSITDSASPWRTNSSRRDCTSASIVFAPVRKS